MEKKIALLPGDGIGLEVMNGAVEILKAIEEHYYHRFHFQYGLIGGAAIDEANSPLPEQTLNMCKEADAVLLGSVGGPKWDQNPSHLRPERGLLALRKELDLYANLRPVETVESLLDSSPLKREFVEGVDFMIVESLRVAFTLENRASARFTAVKRRLSIPYFISVMRWCGSLNRHLSLPRAGRKKSRQLIRPMF